MMFYFKLLLFCFLFQNTLSDDGSLTFSNVHSSGKSSPSSSFLIENNTSFFNSPDNITRTSNASNATNASNSTIPVLLNCTGVVLNNGTANSTDLSQCKPFNFSLTYECTKVNYDFLIYSATWQPKMCYAKNCGSRSYETPKWRIQGLRSSFLNGTRPAQCCSDRQLKVNELDSIYSELKVKCFFFNFLKLLNFF